MLGLCILLASVSNALQPLLPRRDIMSQHQKHVIHQRSSSVALYMEAQEAIMVAGGVVVSIGGVALWLSGSEERARKAEYAKWEAKNSELVQERERLAYMEPRETPWTEAELAHYDGSNDNETGPLLFAADGNVYNVWKGRHFYGPGCEYHIFAGRDATRLLAKGKLEEETKEERKKPLTLAEKGALQGWIYTFKNKYDIVGTLEGYDPKETAF